MTLTEFLLARIAEDEAAVSDWPTDGNWGLYSPGLMWVDPHGRPIYAPRSRVLAECEAKRRIVEEHRPVEQFVHSCADASCIHRDGPSMLACETCAMSGNGNCNTMRLTALPYAEHADYRAEWRS